MIMLVYFVGAFIGFVGAVFMTSSGRSSTDFERAYDMAMEMNQQTGTIIARYDEINEIMVVHKEDVARYKRIEQ